MRRNMLQCMSCLWSLPLQWELACIMSPASESILLTFFHSWIMAEFKHISITSKGSLSFENQCYSHCWMELCSLLHIERLWQLVWAYEFTGLVYLINLVPGLQYLQPSSLWCWVDLWDGLNCVRSGSPPNPKAAAPEISLTSGNPRRQ